MRLGALLGPMLPNASATFLAEQSRTFAGEGFESLWSVQAIGRGFVMSDPFVALSVAASVTDKNRDRHRGDPAAALSPG